MMGIKTVMSDAINSVNILFYCCNKPCHSSDSLSMGSHNDENISVSERWALDKLFFESFSFPFPVIVLSVCHINAAGPSYDAVLWGGLISLLQLTTVQIWGAFQILHYSPL
jgi:hypothetical protein